MRKLLYLGFSLVLVSGVGCALTDYELITDTDQVRSGGTGVVNTQGKAHVIETQVATIWPDGTDELIWFVDQKANGDQALTTYNNFSSIGDPTFHSDIYCNPDWVGCALTTADNPLVGDVDPFDYRLNANCDGFRSLSLLLSTTRYYGECGRARMSLSDRIAFTNMGRIGESVGVEGLFYDLNRGNFSINLDNNAGFATTLPMIADSTFFMGMGGTRKATMDLTNPLFASMGRAYADFLANHGTDQTSVTLTYNGISTNWTIAGNSGISNPGRVLSNINSHF